MRVCVYICVSMCSVYICVCVFVSVCACVCEGTKKAPVEEGGTAPTEEEILPHCLVQVLTGPDTCGNGQKPAEAYQQQPNLHS